MGFGIFSFSKKHFNKSQEYIFFLPVVENIVFEELEIIKIKEKRRESRVMEPYIYTSKE